MQWTRAALVLGLLSSGAVHQAFGLTNLCVGGSENGNATTPEECDDGNNSNTDLCTNLCRTAFCGDGYNCDPTIRAFDVECGWEECDDGDGNNDDYCTTDCRPPRCGDGWVQPAIGEECDDGNNRRGDGCDFNCRKENSQCGDGVVGNQACDDGNAINDDGCTNHCTLPSCGDGIVQQSHGEECDDAHLDPRSNDTNFHQPVCAGCRWVGNATPPLPPTVDLTGINGTYFGSYACKGYLGGTAYTYKRPGSVLEVTHDEATGRLDFLLDGVSPYVGRLTATMSKPTEASFGVKWWFPSADPDIFAELVTGTIKLSFSRSKATLKGETGRMNTVLPGESSKCSWNYVRE